MREETDFLYRRIPNNLRAYSVKEVEYDSPLSSCGLCIVTSYQREQYGKGWKGVTFFVEEPDKHSLGPVTKININGGKSVDSMYLWYDVLRKALCLRGLPPETDNPGLTIRTIPAEGHSLKYLTSP